MRFKPSPVEILLISSVIGIAATFAAPWLELRGTFAAWRIVEWHTFWRGDGSFQLESVVAPDYRVSIEYATREMQSTLAAWFTFAGALGLWHACLLAALIVMGGRLRLDSGVSPLRVMLQAAAISALIALLVYALAMFLALPSSLTAKVDFRAGAEVHSDSLIWSGVTLLPVAPIFSTLAAVIDGITLFGLGRQTKITPNSSA